MRWLILMSFMAVGCSDVGNAEIGEACDKRWDCARSFCVQGEDPDVGAFCSAECRGRMTGEKCGDDERGRCIADSQAWCWLPCETDEGCMNANPDRPVCDFVTLDDITTDFKVCLVGPGTTP